MEGYYALSPDDYVPYFKKKNGKKKRQTVINRLRER